jgi:hypothetical protein
MLSDPISVRLILISSSHLRLGLSSAYFLQYFPLKLLIYFCYLPFVPIVAFAIYFRSQHKESNELGNVEPSASDVGTEHGPSASNFSCSGRGYKCIKLGSCETDSMAPSQEFLCLLWNPRIHWRVTKISPPDPVPRQLSPVHTQAYSGFILLSSDARICLLFTDR